MSVNIHGEADILMAEPFLDDERLDAAVDEVGDVRRGCGADRVRGSFSVRLSYFLRQFMLYGLRDDEKDPVVFPGMFVK